MRMVDDERVFEVLEQLLARLYICDFCGQFKDGFHPIIHDVKDSGGSIGMFQEVINEWNTDWI